MNTNFFLVISIAIGATLVVSLPFSEVSAQLLSEERRNDSTERLGRTNDSSTDNGLLSMLLEPGTTRQNLSSVADTAFAGIEERIDDRLNSIKSKLDQIAAVALPLIIAAVLGIALFASLIVVFILISWYDRFKIYRKNRRDFRNMAEHILAELKDNMDSIRSSSAKTRSNENLNEVNNQNRYIANEELSAAAMKASIISPYFWNLSASAQNATLKLENLIDKYNRVLRRLNEVGDYILLNKMERQNADKMLKVYEETSERYARDINSLSQQLTELIPTQASKGMKPILRSRQKEG